MFTKKHYKAIAEIIRKYEYKAGHREALIDDLCIFFKQDNPNFSKSRFLEACKK